MGGGKGAAIVVLSVGVEPRLTVMLEQVVLRLGQHDALVLRRAVGTAQQVGDLPDQIREVAVVRHEYARSRRDEIDIRQGQICSLNPHNTRHCFCPFFGLGIRVLIRGPSRPQEGFDLLFKPRVQFGESERTGLKHPH